MTILREELERRATAIRDTYAIFTRLLGALRLKHTAEARALLRKLEGEKIKTIKRFFS